MKCRLESLPRSVCVLLLILTVSLLFSAAGCKGNPGIPADSETESESEPEIVRGTNDGFYKTLSQMIIRTDEYWIPQIEMSLENVVGYDEAGFPIMAGASPVKINNETGEVSAVCIDPLCRHSENIDVGPEGPTCPFTGCSAINAMYNDELYYVRNYIDRNGKIGKFHYVIAAYHTVKGTYRELMDYSFTFTSYDELRELPDMAAHTIFQFYVYNGDGYLLKYLPITDNPQTEDDYVLTLVRVDLQTGKFTPLWDRDGKMNTQFNMYGVFDGKALFSDTAIGSLFCYNLADGTEQVLLPGSPDANSADHGYFNYDGIGIYDGWVYYCIRPEEKSTEYIWRLNLETGEREQVSDIAFYSWAMDKNYIYGETASYFSQQTDEYRQMAEPFPAVDGIEKWEQYALFNTIIRLSHDGTNPERLGYSHQSRLIPMPDGLGIHSTNEFFDFKTGLTTDLTNRSHIVLDSTKVPVDDYAFPHPEE